jgi:sugar lactone lactonase YvrE
MLFRKHIVSTRTLLQLTVAVLFLVAAVGAAVAANTGNTPVLVPYTIYTVAGTPQWSFAATPAIVGGFGSMPSTAADGGFGVPYINSAGTLVPGATLNSPWGFAVDSVGDIYIADKSNDLIREVNYSTGLINIVAGITPTGCKSVPGTVNSYNSCTANSGCGDGVLASLAKVGSGIDGVAVDAYGNVYFADSSSSTVSVVYRGGTQVANFIKLVNPAAVANSPNGQVTVGYVYHIAGEINLGSPLNTGATCAGSKSNNSYIIDNAPAFENTAIPGAIVGATLSGPTQITLDSAGNIYISDVGNTTVRVINTQATPQTFFQYTVQPGYMQSITNCGVMTASTPCAATKTAAVGTGINGPSNALLFSSQYVYAGADAYGNVYQLNGTGGSIAVPGYYESVSYAGGVPLTNLLTAEVPTLSSVYSATETAYPVPSSDTKTPNELPLTYGNAYIVISNPSLNSALPSGFLNVIVTTTNQFAIRPVSVKPDSFGNLYYYDNHFQEISRIDQYTADGLLLSSGWAGHPRSQSSVTGLNTVTNLNADGTVSNSSNYNQPASMTTSTTLASPTPNPWDCIYGASGHPWTWGPQTYDPVGDGCPGMIAAVSSSTGTSNGDYFTDNDGLGNLYFGDNYNNLIREMPLGTQFPATPVVPSTAGAWSTTATYALNNVVNYTLPCPPSPATCTATPHAYYISLKAANTGNIPNMSPTYWRMVSETQPIQVHFDVSNIPFTGGGTQASTGFASTSIPDGPSLGYTTNAFTITGSGDFSIDTTDPEYPLGSLWQTSGVYGYTPQTTNFAMYPVYGSTGYPTCTQLGVSSPDNSWDCLVYVTFNPTQPGLRTGQLVATTANGSVYNFQLTGTGTGGQLAIDGGAQQVLATSAGNGLGTLASIAMTSGGTGYIADPTNNRIVVETPSGTSPNQTTIQTAIGPSITVSNTLFGQTTTTKSTLSGPMGVAVDAAGNVYIADTGNSRILEYNPVTGTATQLGNYLWIPGATCDGGTTPAAADCNYTAYTLAGGGFSSSILNEPGASVTPTTAPPQYKFKNPQGLAVDQWGNVYVADTGNSVIVEIPSDTKLGGATQLFQYPGAPTFTTPVAVAIGPMIGPKGENWPGYIFVADTGNPAGEIVRIPPGGGDLQPTTTTTAGTSAMSVLTALPLFGGSLINTPNGVAVDAAGNVYVSDSTGNAVWEAPAVSTSAPFKLNFTGLKAPAGLALDANGNLYVADSGNQQILEMNRQNPVVSFGTVPEGLTAAAQPICANTIISNGLNIGNLTAGVAGTPSDGSCVLTVTNLGNQPVALASTFLGATGNGAYTVSSKGCGSSILVGTTCTISPKFIPATPVPNNVAAVSVNTVNTTQTISLQANGANPEVLITMAPSNGTVVPGTTTNYSTTANLAEAITATVKPIISGGSAPTGTVTFTWTVAPTVGGISCATPGSQTSQIVNLVNGVATTTTFPTPTAGQVYTVNATYNSDTNNSTTSATSILLTTAQVVTTVNVTSTLAQLTYTYGGTVPTIACTVKDASGTTVAGATCTSAASQLSDVSKSPYPIQVVFTGSNACSYGFPTATGQANVIENPAAMTVTIPAYTTVYGAATLNYFTGQPLPIGGMVITVPTALNADIAKVSATFTPADSKILDVVPGSPYTVTATMTGKPILSGDYVVNATVAAPTVSTLPTGTDTITPAPAGITITATNTSIAISKAGTGSTVTGATYTIALNTLVTAGYGTPTGTVSVTDYFVPITPTVFVPTPTSGTFPVINGAITWPTTAAYGVQYVKIPPCSATVTTGCNPVVTFTLTSGAGTFTLPNLAIGGSGGTGNAPALGTHYLSFVYSGDAGTNGDGKGDFSCSVVGQLAQTSPSCPTTNPIPYALIVDNPDFTLTSTTGPISVIPGNVPNGNGLPAAPNQNSANPQSTIITIGGILAFAGQVNLSCAPQNPSYVNCFVGQIVVSSTGATQLMPSATLPYTAPAAGSTATETVAVVFDVSTPLTLPLGFNTTPQLRTTATRAVLAFLPFGVLAFCVRRRRRLSKALWMLIAIAVVSVGMSGCGGNTVDFYNPITTGQQTVTVNASYTAVASVPTQPSVTRSFVVPITIN